MTVHVDSIENIFYKWALCSGCISSIFLRIYIDVHITVF